MSDLATAPRLGISPRTRKSPFFEATRQSGCTAYYVYNHMYLPAFYADPVKDYWRLVEDVTLWDVGVERQVEITGPDAARFTQYLTSRNLTECAVGQCKYVLITAEDGGIVCDPILLRLGENHFWLSISDSDVLLWARGVALHSGMDVDICEPDVWPVQVQGPKSPQLLRDLFGDWVTELRYYWFREAELDGMPVVVARTGWTALLGYEIYLRDGRHAEQLWETILRAGKPYNIAPTGPSPFRRIEAGILNYGADMSLEENPYEVGLGRLVDLKHDADFVGKEALLKIAAEGPKRCLIGVEIDGDPLPGYYNEHPWPVLGLPDMPGRLSNKVTSCAHSPRLKKNIGIAMVPMDHTQVGMGLSVATPEGERQATVVPMPFIDPRKEIPKGHVKVR